MFTIVPIDYGPRSRVFYWRHFFSRKYTKSRFVNCVSRYEEGVLSQLWKLGRLKNITGTLSIPIFGTKYYGNPGRQKEDVEDQGYRKKQNMGDTFVLSPWQGYYQQKTKTDETIVFLGCFFDGNPNPLRLCFRSRHDGEWGSVFSFLALTTKEINVKIWKFWGTKIPIRTAFTRSFSSPFASSMYSYDDTRSLKELLTTIDAPGVLPFLKFPSDATRSPGYPMRTA